VGNLKDKNLFGEASISVKDLKIQDVIKWNGSFNSR
jgi:hypothetical protein